MLTFAPSARPAPSKPPAPRASGAARNVPGDGSGNGVQEAPSPSGHDGLPVVPRIVRRTAAADRGVILGAMADAGRRLRLSVAVRFAATAVAMAALGALAGTALRSLTDHHAMMSQRGARSAAAPAPAMEPAPEQPLSRVLVARVESTPSESADAAGSTSPSPSPDVPPSALHGAGAIRTASSKTAARGTAAAPLHASAAVHASGVASNGVGKAGRPLGVHGSKAARTPAKGGPKRS